MLPNINNLQASITQTRNFESVTNTSKGGVTKDGKKAESCDGGHVVETLPVCEEIELCNCEEPGVPPICVGCDM